MYFNNIYSLTPEQLTECKVKQKGYAKLVTKFLKNREYTVGNHSRRITFRIVSVVPSKNKFGINDYHLKTEISSVERYYTYDGGHWSREEMNKGERLCSYDISQYRYWITDELKMFLLLFSFSTNYRSDCLSIEIDTPKVINRI
jgi:hypothetical protein